MPAERHAGIESLVSRFRRSLVSLLAATGLACSGAPEDAAPTPPQARWSLPPEVATELALGCTELGEDGGCRVAEDGSVLLGLEASREGTDSWLCFSAAAEALIPCPPGGEPFGVPALLRDASGRGLPGDRLVSIRLVRADGSRPLPEAELQDTSAYALLREGASEESPEYHDVAGRWIREGGRTYLSFDAPFTWAPPVAAAAAGPGDEIEPPGGTFAPEAAPGPARYRSGLLDVQVVAAAAPDGPLTLRACSADGLELSSTEWRTADGPNALLPFAGSLDSRPLLLTAETPSGQTLGAEGLRLPISPAEGAVVRTHLPLFAERPLIALRVLEDGAPAEHAAVRVDDRPAPLVAGRALVWWARTEGSVLELEAPCMEPLRESLTLSPGEQELVLQFEAPRLECSVRPMLRSPSGTRFFPSVSRVAMGLGPRLRGAVDAEYRDEAFRGELPCPPDDLVPSWVVETSEELEAAAGAFGEDCTAEVSLRYAKPVLHVILHAAANWTTTELGDAVHFDRFKQHLHDFLREQARARLWSERRLDVVASDSQLRPVYWSAPDRLQTLVGLEEQIQDLELERGPVPSLAEVLDGAAGFLEGRDLRAPEAGGGPSAVVLYLTGQDELDRDPAEVQAALERLQRLGAECFVLQIGRDERGNAGYAPIERQGDGHYRRLRSDQEALRFFGGLFLDIKNSSTFRSLGS